MIALGEKNVRGNGKTCELARVTSIVFVERFTHSAKDKGANKDM